MVGISLLVVSAVVWALAAAAHADDLSESSPGVVRLDARKLDRVVAGATYGISGEAAASADGATSSTARADVDLDARTDGNGATARGTAIGVGVATGERPRASSSADVQASGPFDRVFRIDARRRFGSSRYVVDYSYVSVVAVKLPTGP